MIIIVIGIVGIFTQGDMIGNETQLKREYVNKADEIIDKGTYSRSSLKLKQIIKSETESEDKDENKADYEIFNFKDSGDGKSWLIGNESISGYANAYLDGYSKCPSNLTIPRSLKNREGVTKPVEVIGRLACYTCGWETGGHGKTKSILFTNK